MKGIAAFLLLGLAAAVPVNELPSDDTRTSRPHPTGRPTGSHSRPPLPSFTLPPLPSGSGFPGSPHPSGPPGGGFGGPGGPSGHPHPSGPPGGSHTGRPTGRPTGSHTGRPTGFPTSDDLPPVVTPTANV